MSNILKELLHHEDVLQFNRFDSEIAWRLGSWIVNKARQEELPIALDITVNERCLFHYSSNGASLDNVGWMDRKKRPSTASNTQLLYGTTPKREGEKCNGGVLSR